MNEYLGREVIIEKVGSTRNMEESFIKCHGIVDEIQHSYIRIKRLDLHDPVRSEPFYVSYTFADFITHRYRVKFIN